MTNNLTNLILNQLDPASERVIDNPKPEQPSNKKSKPKQAVRAIELVHINDNFRQLTDKEIKDAVKLHRKRMSDYHELAKQREPMTDNRHMLMFCVALSCRQLGYTWDKSQLQMLDFANKYYKCTDIEKSQYVEKQANLFNEHRFKYYYKDESLIELLGINETELSGLKYIGKKGVLFMNPPPKERQPERTARVNKARDRAKELKSQGYKRPAIAEIMGVKLNTIKWYLKTENKPVEKKVSAKCTG